MRHAFFVMAAIALLSASGSVAAQDGGMFPNVSESKFPQAVYRATYGEQGASPALPKLVVFSAAGKCVGVGDAATTPAGMANFIRTSLRRDQKACEMVVADHLGVSRLGPDAGTGKPEVKLLISAAPTCASCTDFRLTLLRASHSELADMHLNIITVMPDQAAP